MYTRVNVTELVAGDRLGIGSTIYSTGKRDDGRVWAIMVEGHARIYNADDTVIIYGRG